MAIPHGDAPRKREDDGHVGDLAIAPAPAEIRIPLSDDLVWFNDLIGQFTQGYCHLLGGAPGSSKSKFATQLGVDLAYRGEKVLFLLTEESEPRLRSRVATMMWDRSRAEVEATHRVAAAVRRLADPAADGALSRRPPAHHRQPDGTRSSRHISSTLGAHLRRSAPVSQAGLATFGIAHVNKANAIGGPRTLTHNVDTVLVLRQLGNYRLMFSVKNRNGPTDLRRPARLVLDPVSLSLQPAPMSEPLVVSARSYSAGLGETEVQASIGLTLGSRRRIIGSTLPHAEIEQLLDTIGQIPGVDLNDFDFSISCRIPGSRTYWSTLGLALCMCLVGSAQQRPVPPELMFLGEVDLLRRTAICLAS
jgi:DNA repair protein RadA/Sms